MRIFAGMTVSILGCGWYGMELAKTLANKGIKVKGSTTTPEKLQAMANEGIEAFLIDLEPDNKVYDVAFFECDVLWVSIPPRARAGQGAEYLNKLSYLIPIIKSNNIRQVVLISSTGVYADNNIEVTEHDEPKPDTEAGKVLFAAENLLKAETDFSTTIIRFGGLIGPGRDPGRFFAGKTGIANGNAPVNLIHLNDCIGISLAILDKKAFGHTYNAVSPTHPTRVAFYTLEALRSKLPAPEFVAEKNNWKIVGSMNVPEILGYDFTQALA